MLQLSDGTRIRFEEVGAGTPLVLIPGWACSLDVFEHNMPAFAEHFRVIAYDPRSQGGSDQTAKGNNYAQRGDDLHEILEALALPQVNLLGWSLGVYDVLTYLDRHGFDRVQSLVLVDESPKIIKQSADDWGEGEADEVAALIDTVRGPGYLSFFREYMAEGFDGEAPPALLDRMTETAAALPSTRAAALLRDASERDFSALCKEAAQKMPVLQIVREDWSAAARRWIEANQPSARIEVLGSHLMLAEYPDAFNSAVLSFYGAGA
ncbi:MAG: alpha/beta hydrolase [Gammaproteobacteria bacterium]|nr:alpha/beta hydrolase [Gammaproteobacteria bacterium]MCY4198517.1 alpha/beta hydrolase [Gammaproteobacteria bacterium]